jgi:hypothetical protein
MKTQRPRRRTALALAALVAIGCGGGTASGPTPPGTALPESWYVFTGMCSNCPGLTNVEIDRSVTPHRARLAVGRLTGLRAVAVDGCGTDQLTLQIDRWIVSDPSVVKIEPSSSESAIVTALKPGLSRVTAERRLPDGTVVQTGLRDAFVPTPPAQCAPLPELVLEVVP